MRILVPRKDPTLEAAAMALRRGRTSALAPPEGQLELPLPFHLNGLSSKRPKTDH